MTRERAGGRPGGRIALAIFFVCFSLFVANVLLGKLSILYGWNEIPLLGDVAEFFLLLLAVTVFVVAALRREGTAADSKPKNNQS